MRKTLALTAAALLASTGVANAQSVGESIGLYNTGVNNDNTVRSAGQQDIHWTFTPTDSESLPYSPYLYEHPLYVTSPTAYFIAPSADGTGGGGIYEIKFMADPGTTISGYVAYDNTAIGMINGVQFYKDTPDAPGTFPAFEQLHFFSFTTPLGDTEVPSIARVNVAALNFLDFQVGDYDAPSGLLVTDLKMGAVPEPATWAMMVLGFGMVGFGLRSRRKQSVRVTYA